MSNDPLKVDKPGEKINFSAGQRLSDTKNAASKWGVRPSSTTIRQSKTTASNNVRDHKAELETLKESSYKRKDKTLNEEQSKEEEKRLQFYKVKFFKK
jgi:hypothetical protein